MTDADLLVEIRRLAIEGPTWASGLWTEAEVLGYMNQRQNRFLKETAVTVATGILIYPALATSVALPSDWIATIGCDWRTATLNYPLYPGSLQESDWGRPGSAATSATLPLEYSDSDDAPPVLRLIPRPAADGFVDIVYVGLGDPCDGSGVLLTTPDCFTPYLRYGILADMFGKQGRAFDPVRAAYSEERFAEGIELGRRFTEALVATGA